MKAQDFQRWLEHMHVSLYDAEKLFGVTRKTLAKYRDDGGPEWLGYACAAYSQGLKPWGEQ